MENELIKFLSKYPSLSAEDVSEIAKNITVINCKKGTVLLKAGDISVECYFVLKGCIRAYCIVDGEEKTTAFYTENQAAVPFTAITEQTPSKLFMVCLEDCSLIKGNPEDEGNMYQQFPKLEAITRAMVEQDLGKTQDAFSAFITSTAEQRYISLQESRPDLLQRVPQIQLASYIGVTPESLSRIRKRLSLKTTC